MGRPNRTSGEYAKLLQAHDQLFKNYCEVQDARDRAMETIERLNEKIVGLEAEHRKSLEKLCETEKELASTKFRLSRHPVSDEERNIASWDIGPTAIEIAQRIKKQEGKARP